MPHSLWQPPDWHPSCWSSLDYHRHSERNRCSVFHAIQRYSWSSCCVHHYWHLRATSWCFTGGQVCALIWRRTSSTRRPPTRKLFIIIATSVWSHSRALLDWLTRVNMLGCVALPRWLENWPEKGRFDSLLINSQSWIECIFSVKCDVLKIF